MLRKWDYYLLAFLNVVTLTGVASAVVRLMLDDQPDLLWAIAGFACLGFCPGCSCSASSGHSGAS
jgi:hypothetical protein